MSETEREVEKASLTEPREDTLESDHEKTPMQNETEAHMEQEGV